VLVIRAVSFNGRPLGQEILARFDEAGGTIGRGDNSTLVLPDPERFISRTHASISFQAGGFIITDNSTKNPTILNGQPIGPGSAKRLAHGDRIQLGGYVLTVELAAAAAPPAATVATAPRSVAPRDDPWAAFKAPAADAPDPFADLLKPRSSTPPATPPAAPGARPDPLADLGRPPGSAQDPFADLLKPRAPTPPSPATPPTAPARPPDPLADLQGRQPSIDEVLGLEPSGIPDLLGPEGRSIPPAELPGSPGVVDPLELLGGTPRLVPPPTVPDHGPEVFTPYTPPAAKPDPARQARAEPVPLPSPPAPSPSPVGPAASSAEGVRPGSEEPLLRQALLRGAGIPDSALLKSLTPEMMETIGKLLREAVQGTLDLLRARGLTKHEMRADVTMIMPMDNNPLKFSPTVEAAMAHLLAPHVQGFLPPLRAMQNAYDDLRAHELGVLAGMRAALDEVLARFAPEELTKRLSGPGVLDSLLAANRKAKQWDLFVERYEAVAEEARENFHAAFGKAFRRAYEAQVKQVRAEERGG
jgi:FHA domain-containing protein